MLTGKNKSSKREFSCCLLRSYPLKSRLIAYGLFIFTSFFLFMNRSEGKETATPKYSPIVIIKQGRLVGIDKSDLTEYLGVRYALPPVGALRWKPPAPVLPSTNSIIATQYGSHCPQTPSPWGPPSNSEDCLFLNIYVPKHVQNQNIKPFPVMVWIHGGSFTAGAGSLYDPRKIVTQGKVIVVTINYRLGILGFFAHPALDHEGHDSGNYGIMDQQLALRWVKDNIAAFGGDSNNVTIFGESAGGASIYANLVSPLATGLFQKAIIQSGVLEDISLKDAETRGITYAKHMGCSSGLAKQIAACLRSIPISTL